MFPEIKYNPATLSLLFTKDQGQLFSGPEASSETLSVTFDVSDNHRT